MGKIRTPEEILLGATKEEKDKCLEINFKELAKAVGTSSATLCRWRKYGLPENVRVFASLCRTRNMTAEQIGQMVLDIK